MILSKKISKSLKTIKYFKNYFQSFEKKIDRLPSLFFMQRCCVPGTDFNAYWVLRKYSLAKKKNSFQNAHSIIKIASFSFCIQFLHSQIVQRKKKVISRLCITATFKFNYNSCNENRFEFKIHLIKNYFNIHKILPEIHVCLL